LRGFFGRRLALSFALWFALTPPLDAGRSPSARTAAGIDVLELDHFRELAALAGKHGGRLRMGLLTNQTGRDRQGQPTAEILEHQAQAAVPGVELTMLFSPEHGINGSLDTEHIGNSTDRATGLPVVSLYGSTDAERRPSLALLRQLDAVVIDLQDAGVRYYTYETLVRYFLEAAGQTGTDIVILDRPNPLGGGVAEGPISDAGRESYVNAISIPVRHGMTLGELARYSNGVAQLHASLTVVAMAGWRRRDWFDQTNLPWINPSPNLRSLRAAVLYPATGIIETTNISVGRGTEAPFEYVGAPWIKSQDLLRFLNARSLRGVRFLPVSFTPGPGSPFSHQLCNGIRIVVTDRNSLDTPELGIEIASALHQLYGQQFQLDKMDRLLVNRGVLEALQSGSDPRAIARGWQRELDDFKASRLPYLLY
jgi:uncharacterized protein YbbC (DUF1343 family)